MVSPSPSVGIRDKGTKWKADCKSCSKHTAYQCLSFWHHISWKLLPNECHTQRHNRKSYTLYRPGNNHKCEIGGKTRYRNCCCVYEHYYTHHLLFSIYIPKLSNDRTKCNSSYQICGQNKAYLTYGYAKSLCN